MTSKEALNSLEKLLKDLPYAVNLKEYHDAIFKDLDRLEKLEKAIDFLYFSFEVYKRYPDNKPVFMSITHFKEITEEEFIACKKVFGDE